MGRGKTAYTPCPFRVIRAKGHVHPWFGVARYERVAVAYEAGQGRSRTRDESQPKEGVWISAYKGKWRW